MIKIVKTLILLSCFSIISCSKIPYLEKFNLFGNNSNNQYVLGSDDIPLFEGLEELEGENARFDTVSGNIVYSAYVGYLNLEKVNNFYQVTLPELGWKISKNTPSQMIFVRNGDKLEINFTEIGDSKTEKLRVKFFISSVL